MQGDHSTVPAELKPSPEPKLVFPFEAPGFALNHATVSLFNTAFFHKQIKPRVNALQDYEPFFYPLDKVLHWNRMYGKQRPAPVPVRHPLGARQAKAPSPSCRRSPSPASPASSPSSRPSAISRRPA